MSNHRGSLKIYIYALINPINGEYFYVGQSKDMVIRMSGHRRQYGHSKQLKSYVDALSIFNHYPEFKILDEIEACKFLRDELEKCWIGSLLKKGHNLLNVQHRMYRFMNPDERMQWVHEIANEPTSNEQAAVMLLHKQYPDGIVRPVIGF